MRFLRIFLLLTATLLATGCANLGYYSQAVTGQLDILARTRPITELLDDSPAAGMDTGTLPPDRSRRPSRRALSTVLRGARFRHAGARPAGQ